MSSVNNQRGIIYLLTTNACHRRQRRKFIAQVIVSRRGCVKISMLEQKEQWINLI